MATASNTSSLFVLDASNTTQTQFFLVVGKDNNSSSSSTDASKDGLTTPPIKVTLQVSVFEPTTASMKPYCATFDPNPPAPAPLAMEPCFKESDAPADASSTDADSHKSQAFAYDPTTGIVHPFWSSASALEPIDSSANSTTKDSATNSTGDASLLPQENFKVVQSIKGAVSTPMNVEETTGTDATAQAVNDPGADPKSVTLVFTPAGPAVSVVDGPKDVAAFEPASASGDNEAKDNEDPTSSSTDTDSSASSTEASSTTESTMMSMLSSSTPMSTDSDTDATSVDSSTDAAATSTDSSISTDDSASTSTTTVPTQVNMRANDNDSSVLVSTSASATTTATDTGAASTSSAVVGEESNDEFELSSSSGESSSTVSPDVIEKMYQGRQSFHR